MKGFYTCLILLFAVTANSLAQEVDTIPIDIRNLDLKLKKSPMPVIKGAIPFKAAEIAPVIISSKVNYWKIRTSVGINVNQASFSDNWQGGGVSSLSVGGLINWKAEYVKNSYSYISELVLQYGKIKNHNQLQKKNNDRIFWDNKAAFQISKNWYFFGSLTFESQFDKGFSYRTINNEEYPTLISRFMSPGYLTESLGFEYKPSKYFSTRIGTGTAKQTFVLDNDKLEQADRAKDTVNFNTDKKDFYGVPLGKTFRNEIAFQVVSAFEKDIFENINLKTRYAMFIPYENLGYIDHRLDVAITAKINKFMNVSLTGVGLYDRDTHSKIQGSQTLAMGLTFVFPR